MWNLKVVLSKQVSPELIWKDASWIISPICVASKLGFIILKWQENCAKCFFEKGFGKSLWPQWEFSVCAINLSHWGFIGVSLTSGWHFRQMLLYLYENMGICITWFLSIFAKSGLLRNRVTWFLFANGNDTIIFSKVSNCEIVWHGEPAKCNNVLFYQKG